MKFFVCLTLLSSPLVASRQPSCLVAGRATLEEWLLVFHGTTEDPDDHFVATVPSSRTTSTSTLRSSTTSRTTRRTTLAPLLFNKGMAVEAITDNSVHGGRQLDHAAKQSLQNGAGKETLLSVLSLPFCFLLCFFLSVFLFFLFFLLSIFFLFFLTFTTF